MSLRIGALLTEFYFSFLCQSLNQVLIFYLLRKLCIFSFPIVSISSEFIDLDSNKHKLFIFVFFYLRQLFQIFISYMLNKYLFINVGLFLRFGVSISCSLLVFYFCWRNECTVAGIGLWKSVLCYVNCHVMS